MHHPLNNQPPEEVKWGFNWDLFLGRLFGSCIVGCWIIMIGGLGLAAWALYYCLVMKACNGA